METRIITISREFGSGGRSIGKAVAERLNIPYYDKELIKQISEKTGLAPEFVENAGEYAPGKTVFSFLPALGSHHSLSGEMSAADFLWCIQQNVILDLTQKGSCVIVGRCADYILKDHPDALHVFIHASTAFKAERIVQMYGESEKKPEQRLLDKDDRRRAHYKHFTGREWGKYQNYHLSMDSGVLGLDRCVDIIVGIAETQG